MWDKEEFAMNDIKEEKEEKKKEEPEKKNLDGLLPCPFCGGEATVGLGLKHGKPFSIRCRCGAIIYGVSREDAVKKWNTRC